MTLTEVLLAEAEAAYAIAERLFRRVANDELPWTPPLGKEWMTLGQLLMHCARFGCGQAVQGFVTGDWGQGGDASQEVHLPKASRLPSVASVSEALELLAADRRLTLEGIESAGEANLLTRNVSAPWGGPPLALFQQLLHVIAHLAQHKGQLFYYLKLMNKDVTTPDLWGT